MNMTAAEARAIAKEAYIYGFPMVDNMRVQYAYFTDNKDPDFKAPYNTLFNIPRVFTPDDKAIQTHLITHNFSYPRQVYDLTRIQPDELGCRRVLNRRLG